MKKNVKSHEQDADDSSPLSRLPDEIILQILNKLIDLKTLCFCYLVSRRFSSIVLQVDAISFATPHFNPTMPDKSTFDDVAPTKPLNPITYSSRYNQLIASAFMFLYKFKGVKSLCIELSSPWHRGNDNKWKVKFGNKIESVFFLSPDSVSDTDGFDVDGNGDEEEDMDLSDPLFTKKLSIALDCVWDAFKMHRILMYLVKEYPMLEQVSLTDSWRSGRFSLCGGKLANVKEQVHSASEIVDFDMNLTKAFYVPVLKLPVSGYVMKGIILFVIDMNGAQGENDGLMISEDGFEDKEDGFEDKEEAAYTEALMQILKKPKGMKRLI